MVVVLLLPVLSFVDFMFVGPTFMDHAMSVAPVPEILPWSLLTSIPAARGLPIFRKGRSNWWLSHAIRVEASPGGGRTARRMLETCLEK